MLFLSDGSQAKQIVCMGTVTVDDLKLALVTLAAAMEVAPQKPIFSPSRPFDRFCNLTGDKFLLKARLKQFFRHETTSLVYS